jgi:hypothetical protein
MSIQSRTAMSVTLGAYRLDFDETGYSAVTILKNGGFQRNENSPESAEINS